MFVSEHVPGSVHDYVLHKSIYQHYVPYLHMTEDEIQIQQEQVNPPYWPIMGDKGYVGPAVDTEPIPRIVPSKGKLLTANQQARNAAINKKRVVIEQFFGRLCCLWAIFRNTWRFDRGNFDDDFTIACLLTNEHIQEMALAVEDSIFYDHWRAQRIS
jgi:hypothetical protein